MCFVFRVKEVCVEREYSFIIKLMSFTRARYFFLVVSVVFVKHVHSFHLKKKFCIIREKKNEKKFLLHFLFIMHTNKIFCNMNDDDYYI